MGKYTKYNPRSRMPEQPWRIHPVWRGIGCLLLVIIPAVSYAGAVLLIEANLEYQWLPISFDLAKTVVLPFIGKVPFFYARLILTGLLVLIGYGVVVMLYSILYSFIGPPRYGPLDAPPERRRPPRRR